MTIKNFPNNLGADVSSGSARFEIFFPEPWRPTYNAKRVDADGYGIAYKEGFAAETVEQAAAAVVKDWRENRKTWTPCQNF